MGVVNAAMRKTKELYKLAFERNELNFREAGFAGQNSNY